MKKHFHLEYIPIAGYCPYRLLDRKGNEVSWACQFLDAQYLRGLSPYTLRIYGYDLLNFCRWMHQTRSSLSCLTQSRLLDYLRFQVDAQPKPAPQTVNHRLVVLHCLYRFHYGSDLPDGRFTVRSTYKTRSPIGYGRPGRALGGLRMKESRRVMIPLSANDVSLFWSSFHTFRDLALVALMLFNGLRSLETIQIQLEDLLLTESQLRVRGKGRRERIVPLANETIQSIERYVSLERTPDSNHPHLFLSLKGPQKGKPMTTAGLRSLFRHHRRCSEVPQANPHRFRHTFGSDMVRAGISLPALMRLMGHSNIHITMRYVELSRHDVWCEYIRALEKRVQSSVTVSS
jgi:site-specific recombinase XerD